LAFFSQKAGFDPLGELPVNGGSIGGVLEFHNDREFPWEFHLEVYTVNTGNSMKFNEIHAVQFSLNFYG
jgi:hypothetical protein